MSGFRNPAFASLRYGFGVLALLALSALLLRPVCDALEPLPEWKAGALQALAAAQDHHDPETCCDALSADGPLLAASAFLSVTPDDSSLAVPVLVLRQEPRLSIHAAVDPPRLPPRSLRYHSRTARILV